MSEPLELTVCPECGAAAEVIDRFVLPSTHGPVAHVKLRCVTGPWVRVPPPASPERLASSTSLGRWPSIGIDALDWDASTSPTR
jgi:hypothetical protein